MFWNKVQQFLFKFNESAIVEEDEWKSAIRRYNEFLGDRMFTDFGLLDKLWMARSISDQEMQEIKEPGTFYKRNKKCLDIILTSNKHNEFIEALNSSGQTHLINYLKTNGNYSTEFDGNWPLTENEMETLQSNHGMLLDLLDTCDLLSHLYSMGAINRRQRDFINSKPTPYEKNEALLDILRRSSLNAYKQTIRCLQLSNQSHVAEILENGGILVRIDSRLQGETTVVNILEHEIAAGITHLLGNRSLPESNRIWELVQLNLVAARQGYSVDLYFLCHQLSDVDRLQQMTKDGLMMEIIETVFNRLIKTSYKIRVQLKQITPEYKKCRQYFKDIKQPKGDKTIPSILPPTMRSLPFELLDSILLKSYLQHYVVKDKQSLKNKDLHIITELASVDFCWFQRIRKRKFKKEVWRCLAVFYRRKEKLSSIYRNNRQYLKENIRLRGVINRLRSNDCLTDAQTASLYRRNLALRKKDSSNKFRDQILDVVIRLETFHSVFRRCLMDTKQHLIREVILNGGAVVKVGIRFRRTETLVKTRHRNLQIVEGMNEIRDTTKNPRSHQIVELMAKLEKDDLEILNAGQDGYVIVVWIWCKTKYSLDKLQVMNKSKRIIDVSTELLKNLSFLSEEQNPEMIKPNVNIDFEEFEKTIVCKETIVFFSILANFTSSLALGRRVNENVVGVTKHRDEIHVLLRNHLFTPHCVILVFEDQFPFRLQKRIEFKEIGNPKDIAYTEIENSLYVLDTWKCVWKIKVGDVEGGVKKEKIIRWLDCFVDGPDTLSVTRNGQLLLIGRRIDDPFWSLLIIGGRESEEADLQLSIPLPEDIQRPSHAVETSKGNFIIFHAIRKEKLRSDVGTFIHLKKEEEMMVVSEVSEDGKTILRRFIPRNKEQVLSFSGRLDFGLFGHLAVDSLNRVFLTDYYNDRVILLDSDLQWNGILIPTEKDGKEGRWIYFSQTREIRRPWRLFYDEEKKELIVGGLEEVFVYTLNRKLKQ